MNFILGRVYSAYFPPTNPDATLHSSAAVISSQNPAAAPNSSSPWFAQSRIVPPPPTYPTPALFRIFRSCRRGRRSTILVPHQAKCSYTFVSGSLVSGIRIGYPKAKLVHSVRAFGHRKKRFTVRSFDSRKPPELPVVFHRAGVERSVDAHPLHQVRVILRVEIIAPEQWSVLAVSTGFTYRSYKASHRRFTFFRAISF